MEIQPSCFNAIFKICLVINLKLSVLERISYYYYEYCYYYYYEIASSQ